MPTRHLIDPTDRRHVHTLHVNDSGMKAEARAGLGQGQGNVMFAPCSCVSL